MTVPFQARIARDLVVVEGPDATSFLQSLVSQDLDAIAVGEGAHSLLLQPQGKLLVDHYALHREADTWWCVCEGGLGEALSSGLNRFKIRVKADVRQVEVSALALRGVQPPAGSDGVQIVFSRAVDAPVVDADAYENARIEAGVPRQGLDTDERTIPQEAGLDRVAVSFTKGCFVGQELVCRIDTRGHVNRNLRRLRAPVGDLSRGATVAYEGREVGEVTSASGSVALAMLRREVEPGARVGVGASAVTAVVEAL